LISTSEKKKIPQSKFYQMLSPNFLLENLLKIYFYISFNVNYENFSHNFLSKFQPKFSIWILFGLYLLYTHFNIDYENFNQNFLPKFSYYSDLFRFSSNNFILPWLWKLLLNFFSEFRSKFSIRILFNFYYNNFTQYYLWKFLSKFLIKI